MDGDCNLIFNPDNRSEHETYEINDKSYLGHDATL